MVLTVDAPGLDHPILSAEEERVASREELVLCNLRLVCAIACRYARRVVPGPTTSVDDLFSAGLHGLLIAAGRFEPGRGHRFSTFAVHWVRQTIGRHLDDNARAVRVPVHAAHKLRRRLRDGDEDRSACEAAAERVARARTIPTHAGEGEERPHLDLVDERPGPHEAARLCELRERVARAVDEHLSGREAEVVRRRFGLAGGPAEGLRQVARRLGMSSEGARQVERRALDRLRDLCPKLAEL